MRQSSYLYPNSRFSNSTHQRGKEIKDNGDLFKRASTGFPIENLNLHKNVESTVHIDPQLHQTAMLGNRKRKKINKQLK